MGFKDLWQFRTGYVAPLILCGIVLGAVIAWCMHKPPAAGRQNVQSSSGQVHAACQPGTPAASPAPLRDQSELLPQCLAATTVSSVTVYPANQSNAYSILEPDWGGIGYRLKTIVNK